MSSITEFLNSLHSHLQAQSHLLPSLHDQLGLPVSALEEELAAIKQILIDSVEAQIESRRREVEIWVEKCEAVEHTCRLYSKSLGGHVKNTGKSVGEIRKEKALPHRFKLASELKEELRQLYHIKLEQLTTLSSHLHAMARVLGNEIFIPDVLDDDLDTSTHRDVTPERFARMDNELERGKEEVTNRLQQLCGAFKQIDRLCTELGRTPSSLDDLPSSLLSPPSFSSSIITSTPSRNSIHRDFQGILANFVAKGEEADDEGNPLIGLEHVDPNPGLLKWAADVLSFLEDDKRKRETHIQVMYDEMQDIVKRFAVKEVDMVAFGNAHQGWTNATVKAYQDQLGRMRQVKRERMSMFVQNAREEIIKLWDELMVAEEERQGFAALSDDVHTEQLLNIHEAEIKELEAEKLMKAPLLAVINKYIDMSKEEEALATPDPTRLTTRVVGAHNRLAEELKTRKKIEKEKPQLEQELLAELPIWELKAGRSFLVYGESFLEKLNAGRENKQKPLRVGSVPPRSTTPATKSGVVVPAVRHAGSSEQSGPNKRIKLDQSTDRAGFSRSRSASGSKQNAASSLPMPIPKPGTGRVVSGSAQVARKASKARRM